MLESLKKIFGSGPSVDYGKMVAEGAIILDVRSRGEYASGHINGSINIPVDELANQLNKLKDKSKTIITCCASGMRSGSAKNILESKGYTSIHNGGGWFGLNGKLQ